MYVYSSPCKGAKNMYVYKFSPRGFQNVFTSIYRVRQFRVSESPLERLTY